MTGAVMESAGGVPTGAHPFLIELTQEQARPVIAQHAQAHGWSVPRYTQEVRAHLAEALRGCRFWVRMTPERLTALLEHGELSMRLDRPGQTFDDPLRAFLERLTFHPLPDVVTYGYMAEEPATYFALADLKVAVELNVIPEATFFEGDQGWVLPVLWSGTFWMTTTYTTERLGIELSALLSSVWERDPDRARGMWHRMASGGGQVARLPSPVQRPSELSWGWIGLWGDGQSDLWRS
ncbi:hypothetical protein E7T09_12975 [Deinococcus sp. KSM4-11]|uniref:hypothetical protein n=1 Tax=Deinococcus sp. KSM4-11 TaxID=2568654 RepID=UPI0010A30137|nr:hypothetical protein [Deinococcus sp. KSM4-11]THF86137.1 hypothetical protein E7T09_12975 [Deinococcus sp. KSM4-11]